MQFLSANAMFLPGVETPIVTVCHKKWLKLDVLQPKPRSRLTKWQFLVTTKIQSITTPCQTCDALHCSHPMPGSFPLGEPSMDS